MFACARVRGCFSHILAMKLKLLVCCGLVLLQQSIASDTYSQSAEVNVDAAAMRAEIKVDRLEAQAAKLAEKAVNIDMKAAEVAAKAVAQQMKAAELAEKASSVDNARQAAKIEAKADKLADNADQLMQKQQALELKAANISAKSAALSAKAAEIAARHNIGVEMPAIPDVDPGMNADIAMQIANLNIQAINIQAQIQVAQQVTQLKFNQIAPEIKDMLVAKVADESKQLSPADIEQRTMKLYASLERVIDMSADISPATLANIIPAGFNPDEEPTEIVDLYDPLSMGDSVQILMQVPVSGAEDKLTGRRGPQSPINLDHQEIANRARKGEDGTIVIEHEPV